MTYCSTYDKVLALWYHREIFFLYLCGMVKHIYMVCVTIVMATWAYGQEPLPYDTIIDRGIYQSYYNRQYSTASFVRYRLYMGGGRCSRKGMDFLQTVAGCIYHYSHSGYDKGHLVPAADFAHDEKQLRTTFDYVNCLPQTPRLNRGEWKRDETKVRKWSQKDSLIIEAGGKSFQPGTYQVPKYCYKIVISLSTGDTLLNKVYLNK